MPGNKLLERKKKIREAPLEHQRNLFNSLEEEAAERQNIRRLWQARKNEKKLQNEEE
ncbi:Uncharacterised protein [uncultured archaeon]|nr:Uncharacterised protein [uncultured archaeon]